MMVNRESGHSQGRLALWEMNRSSCNGIEHMGLAPMTDDNRQVPSKASTSSPIDMSTGRGCKEVDLVMEHTRSESACRLWEWALKPRMSGVSKGLARLGWCNQRPSFPGSALFACKVQARSHSWISIHCHSGTRLHSLWIR